jgi:thiamine biosynthesis lipoprotein ApbE
MLKRLGEETVNPSVNISEANFPAPFVSGLEYGAPARGTWNIVHVGMLIPGAHQIFVCAQGCLRGVVLTAAEMGASDRFSTISIQEHNVLDGDMEDLIIDEEASTVFLQGPEMSLDVGAVAKGWSVQRVAEKAPSGLLLSVGGNVCATGPKDSADTPWVVGIEDPQGGSYLHTLNVRTGALVTSGDYQRYYLVDGKPYHHIIDPDTLMPAQYWSSVTILCDDSGLADALSTALFLLPQAEGQKILAKCGAEAMWVDSAGRCYYSPGFRDHIRT